jgi:hypothetical protein
VAGEEGDAKRKKKRKGKESVPSSNGKASSDDSIYPPCHQFNNGRIRSLSPPPLSPVCEALHRSPSPSRGIGDLQVMQHAANINDRMMRSPSPLPTQAHAFSVSSPPLLPSCPFVRSQSVSPRPVRPSQGAVESNTPPQLLRSFSTMCYESNATVSLNRSTVGASRQTKAPMMGPSSSKSKRRLWTAWMAEEVAKGL